MSAIVKHEFEYIGCSPSPAAERLGQALLAIVRDRSPSDSNIRAKVLESDGKSFRTEIQVNSQAGSFQSVGEGSELGKSVVNAVDYMLSNLREWKKYRFSGWTANEKY